MKKFINQEFTESETIDKINKMIDLLTESKTENLSLKDLNKRSFELRQNGEDMIYFAYLNKNQGDDDCLVASPTSNQKEYKSFFNIKTKNSVLPKYTIYIYNHSIRFTKREVVIDEQGKKYVITDLRNLKK